MTTKKRVAATSRPFRIWDAKAKKNLPGCCYAIEKNAHNGALKLAAWAKVNQTFEVIDVRGMILLGQYTMKLKSVKFERYSDGKG